HLSYDARNAPRRAAMRTFALATLTVVIVVLCMPPLPAAALSVCFQDQLSRVYTLYLTGAGGPMIQLAGTQTTPASGSSPTITRILSGGAYLSGLGFA